MKTKLKYVHDLISELNGFQKNILSYIIDILEGINENEIKDENSYILFSEEILTVSITSINDTENFILLILQPDLVEIFISRFVYVFIDDDNFKDKSLVKNILVEFLNGNYLIKEMSIGKNIISTEIFWTHLEDLNRQSNSSSIKSFFYKITGSRPEIKDYMGEKISFKVY